jgi:hypothetical protein
MKDLEIVWNSLSQESGFFKQISNISSVSWFSDITWTQKIQFCVDFLQMRQ